MFREIVIKISEDDYNNIEPFLNGEEIEGGFNLIKSLEIIKNGIPLPKGHGRLIDADYLREDFKASKKISFAERMDISCIVDHAPTIIDKEG